MRLSEQTFIRANPEIDFVSDGDGVVTPRDRASKNGKPLGWYDPAYVRARRYAETGYRPTEDVRTSDWFFGWCANLGALKVVAPLAVTYAAFGTHGTFHSRLTNAFTYMPRWFATLGPGAPLAD